MALTPNDVLNKQFQTTKFRDGYDQDEVDDFLDEVLAEFQRLIAANDELKAQLSAAPAASADSGESDALRRRLLAAEGEIGRLAGELSESQQALVTAQQQAAAGATMLDGMNSAEYLQLARRVHEEHVREGVAKRDELIAEGESKSAQMRAEAQTESEQLLSQAQAQATQLTNDAQAKADEVTSQAQAKADALVTEAQTQRDTQLGTLAAEVATLTASRDALQAGVDELKEFERNYRTSLKSYLETQLGELTASGIEFPATGAVAAPAFSPEPESVPEPVSDSASDSQATGGSFAWEPASVEETHTETPSFGFPAEPAAVEPDFGTTEEAPAVTYEIPDLETTGERTTPPAFGASGEQPPASGFGGN